MTSFLFFSLWLTSLNIHHRNWSSRLPVTVKVRGSRFEFELAFNAALVLYSCGHSLYPPKQIAETISAWL